MKSLIRAIGALLLVCAAAIGADVPQPSGYRINDHAELLTQEQRDLLEDKLRTYEEETSNQFVLLTVKSLDGDTHSEFANRVFHEWKLGQKDRDNGILVMFSLGDRKLWIEVGYGLEGAVPDATAKKIYQEIAALTKQHKYYEGFDLGFDSLIKATKGEYASSASADLPHGFSAQAFMFGLTALIIVIMVGVTAPNLVGAIVSFVVGGLYGGACIGGFGTVLLCAVIGLVVFIVVYGICKGPSSSSRYGYGGSSSGGSLFDGIDFSSSGSSSSGGDFGGGGGDSGGGGAGGDA